MAQTELMTARYFEQAEEERRVRGAAEAQAAAEAALAEMPQATKTETGGWEAFARKFSYGVAGVASVCILLAAIPFLSGLGKQKRVSALDFWLRLGGASSDQTFAQFLQDSAKSTQYQLDSLSSQSPALQFDSQNINWQQFQPTVTFRPSSLGSKRKK
jgi:hypothetical protein